MIDGIVSNCWQSQLAAGVSLEDLIAGASRRGYRTIELRQGCLGAFETANREPIAERLAEFPSMFPGVRFNVAIEQAFLSPERRIDDAIFAAGKWAAAAVAGETPPHLRLVDLATSNADWASIDVREAVEDAAARIAGLTKVMIGIDGVLSLEHARQSWRLFRFVFDAARKHLGRDANRLKICFDPCNLLFADDDTAPVTVTASLAPDEISMVHFKQRADGEIRPTLDSGDVDWNGVCAALIKIGYSGAGLFEIPPTENIWENLETSRDFLKVIGSN